MDYRIGNDLKLRLAFVINEQRVSPDLVPFDIRVWTLYPSQAKIASYDGTNWVNCLMRDDYLEVILNAPQFNTGRLNADITLHYPDDDFPDKIRDKIVKVRLDNPLVNPKTNDVIITGEISDTIAGLSAYGVAVWNGFEGTEEEWLLTLKQPAIDAAAVATAAATAATNAAAAATSAAAVANEAATAAEAAEAAASEEAGNAAAATEAANTATAAANLAASAATNAAAAATSAAAASTNATNAANAAAIAANTEAGTALAATEAANAAAEAANLAASAATSTANAASAAATAATNAASAANAAATAATNAVSSATSAATSANTATENANTAATSATNAVSSATSAATSANTATENANTATTAANNAAAAAVAATEAANAAAARAEDAAIDAENIVDSKIDKSSITQYFGGDETKVMSQKSITDNISQILQLEGEELWAYGVRWTQGQSPATLERIGNLNMHKTLPCHKTRGCLVLDDGTINYYLHDSTDFLKEDGVTPSVLDGTDGDVMNQRKFYYRTAIKDNVHVNWMSPYPLPGYTLYENLTGRYKASINRTTGKIHSVINNSPQFRGGNNTSAWDSDGRSLIGCAVSSVSRVTLRSGARINRAIECNGTPEHDDFFARLIYARVKWATHNFQLPFNPMLDANGYYQGGFGVGATNLSGAIWNGYNGYNPFIPCGYTAEFGNGSGVKDFVMPFEYDGYNTTLSQQKYVGVYDSGRIYATGEYVSDSLDTYKGSGDALLYLCILDAPAGTSLTNTTYFSLVDRTVTQAIRMDGEEQWFGEIWEHYANVIIEHNADVEPKTSKAYIFNNPSQIAETKTGNEEFLCDLPISDGYIKEFNAGSIFPIRTGGGSTTYGCDYYYCNYPASGIATRGCRGGGHASHSSNAGPSCSGSSNSPSASDAYIGGRLVRKSKNRVIID